MSNELKEIQEFIIYQEQNARTNISSISLGNIEEVDSIVGRVDSNEEESKILEFCENYLISNRNNPFALYVAGILQLRINTLNDAYILKVLDLFASSKKWNIVEFVSKKILSFRNNLQALRHLAMVYEDSDRESELLDVWEQIVRIDYEEADILYKLANHKMKNSEIDSAIKDYKKSIQRYLHHKNFNAIKDIWKVLLDNQIFDLDFYFQFASKVERIISVSRSEELLLLLYQKLKPTHNHDHIILSLKTLLRISPDSEELRENLIEAYREKYKDNPKLEDFIRMSNLTQSWRNIQEAVSDFEKHIAFFPGSFVFHSKWGIGRIKETTHQYLLIDFSKKRDHQMEISMAVTSLEVLDKSHFWVLKTIMPKEKLKESIQKKPIWALKKILTSLDGADTKTIKSELVPSILTQGEWNSWNVKIRKILNENPYFSIRSEKTDEYVFSDKPVSAIEKFYKLFRQEDSFTNKVKLFRKAIDSDTFTNEDVDEDTFLSILEYFNSYVNTSVDNENYSSEFINSLFVCDELASSLPASKYHIHVHLSDFIPRMSTNIAKQIIKKLKVNAYKSSFFKYIKSIRDDWRELYLVLLPHFHTLEIIRELENEKEIELLKSVYQYILSNINDYKQGHIWFVVNLHDEKWMQEVASSFKISCDLIRTAILLYRDIQNKHQVLNNKKLFKTIETFLFESQRVEEFIMSEDIKNVSYLYSLIKQISDLIPNRILQIRDLIVKYHPNFDFQDQFDFEQSGSTGFLTLPSSFDEKKKILQHIHEIEVPLNSKEIEKARSYGDLKENAEYKAALEHQESLNNRVAQLKKEIEQARIFDTSTVSVNSVGFGTKIQLTNDEDNSVKTYTILGPWESEPEKHVISYLSPLGQQLYKKKLNEKLKFTLNDQTFSMTITNIESTV